MTNKMWGGRFQSGPDAIMEEINASIGFDKRLFRQDISGSKAHASMLAKQGIISKSDAAEIRKGLVQVQGEIEAGTFTFSRALEDIHLNVESRLKDIIGPAAGRLGAVGDGFFRPEKNSKYLLRKRAGLLLRKDAPSWWPNTLRMGVTL